MKLARLREIEDGKIIAVRTAYDAGLIDGFKSAFFPRERRWDGANKVWRITARQRERLTMLLATSGYDVLWDDTLLDPARDAEYVPCFRLAPLVRDAMDATAAPSAPVIRRGDLSPDQAQVFEAVMSWHKDPSARNYLTFGGLAGTGKTTVLSALCVALPAAEEADDEDSNGYGVCVAAYTGKAAGVLRKKLAASGLLKRVAYCGTLHGLVFVPVSDEKTGKVTGWVRRKRIPGDFIIVDEASMVGAEIWEALCAFDVPILAVGDHGQLPPVERGAVNLMANPDLRLEKIHRQAEGSPIPRLPPPRRAGGSIPPLEGDAN